MGDCSEILKLYGDVRAVSDEGGLLETIGVFPGTTRIIMMRLFEQNKKLTKIVNDLLVWSCEKEGNSRRMTAILQDAKRAMGIDIAKEEGDVK